MVSPSFVNRYSNPHDGTKSPLSHPPDNANKSNPQDPQRRLSQKANQTHSKKTRNKATRTHNITFYWGTNLQLFYSLNKKKIIN